MNILSNVAIIVIPRWVKGTIIAILTMLALAYFGLSVLGIYDPSRPGWIEAGTYILGILLPFILTGLIIGFSQSGVEALLRRNADFLGRSLPNLAVLLGDPDGPMADATGAHTAPAPRPQVQVQYARNSSIANYAITIDPDFARNLDGFGKTRRLLFRIELNAMKANVNVMLPRSAIKTPVRELLPHSIQGAMQEGYWFADLPLLRKFAGMEYEALVAVMKLDEDFMTNAVKRLQFGQDLMLMLRSFLHERPELFAVVEQDG